RLWPGCHRDNRTAQRRKYLIRSSRQTKGDGRCNRHDLLMFGLDQLPAALMHHPMVPATEQDQVVEVGRTALDPMHEMMSIAHRGGAFAPRPLAAPVASLQCAAESSRDHPLGAPDVDRYGVLAEQDASHAAVAGHPPHPAG